MNTTFRFPAGLAVLLVATVTFGELLPRGVVVNGAKIAELERRDFADGTAVRYRLPDGPRRISGEDTVWTLPEDATAWYQLDHDECGGFSYESLYSEKPVAEIPVGSRIPLPVVFKLKDGSYRMITEANVVDYTDSCVVYRGHGRFEIDYYCDPQGFEQEGSVTTPWRVEIVAKDLETLATSDMVRRLCPPPSPATAAKCAKFVKPGRAVWQWLADGNPVYGEQRSWYDRTKELGYEYYLIDAGWRKWQDGEKDRWACLEYWIGYGKSIGVESFVWVHSEELQDPVQRRECLAKIKAAGAAGIKIDFVPPPSCRVMKWYEDTLADTLEFGLMTDFHGCVKPSGRERTWPHEVAREAIRGHEYHVTRYHRILPPEHDTIVPFSRLVQGHADYTPTVLGARELVRYTWPREAAQSVAYAAPFLCTGDYPENYLGSPMREILEALPAVYDETRILSGAEIGRLYAAARRKGDVWFVAVMNATGKRQWTLDCSFLGEGRWRMLGFRDDPRPRLDGAIRMDLEVTKDSRLGIPVNSCGGFIAMIGPAASGDGQRTATTYGSEHPITENERPGRENVEWSIGYNYGCRATDGLPRVMLIGDSITAHYQELVGKHLEGRAHCGYWASSYCVASKMHRTLLRAYLTDMRYDVIHFNNGLHSLATDPEVWARALGEALRLCRELQPQARIIWCSSTTVEGPGRNERVMQLNERALAVCRELGIDLIDDQFALVSAQPDAHTDPYHLKEAVEALQAKQVAEICLKALDRTRD